jgi:hypothetical protein
MALSLKDYYLLRDMGALTENATRHIEGKLQDLKEEYKALDKKIPENILKKGLGQNYKFHENLKKLTTKALLHYFETNYILHTDTES